MEITIGVRKGVRGREKERERKNVREMCVQRLAGWLHEEVSV